MNKLDPRKKFQDDGHEQQGDIASDFYTLGAGGSIRKPYVLGDYDTRLRHRSLDPRTRPCQPRIKDSASTSSRT